MPNTPAPRSRKPPDRGPSRQAPPRTTTAKRQAQAQAQAASEPDTDTDTESETESESSTDSDADLTSDANSLDERVSAPTPAPAATSSRRRGGVPPTRRTRVEESSDSEDERGRASRKGGSRRVRGRMVHERREEERAPARGPRSEGRRDAEEKAEERKGTEKEMEEKKGKLAHADYAARANQVHGAYNRQPAGSECGCGCLHGLISSWKKFWGWRGWKVLARWMPYVLALVVVVSAGILGASGPLGGYYVLQGQGQSEEGAQSAAVSRRDEDSSGPTYGAWGWCQSQETGCTSVQPFYSGPTESFFPGWFMPLLLLSMGGLALIHLIILLIITIWIRYPVQGYCGCVDLEAQSHPKSAQKWSLPSRKARALRWFDRSMSLMTLFYAIVAALLTWWVSTAHADGLWPWGFNTFLLLSPLIWPIIRAIYRSRWAYTGNSRSREDFIRDQDGKTTGANSRPRQRRTGNVSQNYAYYAPVESMPQMNKAMRPAKARPRRNASRKP